MKSVGQENSVISKIFRKDEMDRLRKKIEEIKSRRPKKQKECMLPKLQNNKSLSPQRLEQIMVQNKRLNSRINESTIRTHRRSDLNLLNSMDVNKAYKCSELKAIASTGRDRNSRYKENRASKNKLNFELKTSRGNKIPQLGKTERHESLSLTDQ